MHSDSSGLEGKQELSGGFKQASFKMGPARLLLIIALSIFIAEGLIMFLFSLFPPLHPVLEGVVDAFLLVITVCPVLYFFLFNPLVTNIAERQRVEELERLKSVELTQLVSQLNDYADSLRLDVKGAKGILDVINGEAPSRIDIGNGNKLSTFAVSMPCAEEGGDHYFIKEMPAANGSKGKTVISVKDQSGHSVPCLLRSIATDIVHNSIISQTGVGLESSINELNKRLCGSSIFGDGEYFTSISGEIDHETLMFHYSCNGHPQFFHVRDGAVSALPVAGTKGHGMPLVLFEDADISIGHLQLQTGDKLVFYTDGLFEMMAFKDESFGLEDLRGIVSAYSGSSVSELIGNVLQEMGDASGNTIDPHLGMNDSEDDITIVGIELLEVSSK